MYSGSRGILYTAPPGPDDEPATDDADAPTTTAVDSETATDWASAQLAADD